MASVKDETRHNQASTTPGAVIAPLMLSNIHILLVDDSGDNRLLMSKILKSTGAIVDMATNGEEAIEGTTSSIFDDISKALDAGGFSY